ncbi:hypothetical protein PSTT_10202 [Puccinia striiformis]|uniref:GH26 domain-containing protein n=1 Tax=Puccinia striiformis TaxID=27350 RepID=A0A2S4V591_9BASI|nr:hypothetical protein PSTT_10202 [Puccinia striiformis]
MGEVDQIYFGVWVDPDLGFQDTPALFNARLQRNASVFHIAQRMPLLPYNYTTGVGPAPEYLVENTATDAAVFLTVYPAALSAISDTDYSSLGTQLLACQYQGFQSNCFLRWAPEMQGRWNEYGQQPVAYVQAWQTMYKAVKSIAPATIIVWAPNLGHDYPYGQTANIDPTDMAVLDTNKNGELDKGDDPYTPYYPGDDYVDWIGISVYFKQFSRNVNWAQPPGFSNKACLIAESGAAYHSDVAGGATELSSNRLGGRIKVEADIGPPDVRDYRLTNKTEILTAFQTDLTAVQNNYLWAQHRPITRPIQVNGPGVSAPSTASFSVPTLILQTARNPLASGLPTLFGVKRHSGVDKRRTELSRALCVVGASSLVLVWGLIGKSRKRAIHKRTPISTIVQ